MLPNQNLTKFDCLSFNVASNKFPPNVVTSLSKMDDNGVQKLIDRVTQNAPFRDDTVIAAYKRSRAYATNSPERNALVSLARKIFNNQFRSFETENSLEVVWAVIRRIRKETDLIPEPYFNALKRDRQMYLFECRGGI